MQNNVKLSIRKLAGYFDLLLKKKKKFRSSKTLCLRATCKFHANLKSYIESKNGSWRLSEISGLYKF